MFQGVPVFCGVLVFGCSTVPGFSTCPFVQQQVKTKYCSGITQAGGCLPHMVKFDL